MSTMRHLLLPLLLLTTFASCSLARTTPKAAPPVPPNLGGWEAIKNLNNPHVRDISQFAIATYNKQEHKNLTLILALQGYQQIVAGTNYNLTLLVKDGSFTFRYTAIVYENPKAVKQLESFELVVIPGGWFPIPDVNDPHVRDIAEFAVSKYTKKKLALVQVMQGQSQVVAGIKYELVLTAKDEKGAVGKYEAMVLEKAWEKYRELLYLKPLKT